jgi:hypothetical protein
MYMMDVMTTRSDVSPSLDWITNRGKPLLMIGMITFAWNAYVVAWSLIIMLSQFPKFEEDDWDFETMKRLGQKVNG